MLFRSDLKESSSSQSSAVHYPFRVELYLEYAVLTGYTSVFKVFVLSILQICNKVLASFSPRLAYFCFLRPEQEVKGGRRMAVSMHRNWKKRIFFTASSS